MLSLLRINMSVTKQNLSLYLSSSFFLDQITLQKGQLLWGWPQISNLNLGNSCNLCGADREGGRLWITLGHRPLCLRVCSHDNLNWNQARSLQPCSNLLSQPPFCLNHGLKMSWRLQPWLKWMKQSVCKLSLQRCDLFSVCISLWGISFSVWYAPGWGTKEWCSQVELEE